MSKKQIITTNVDAFCETLRKIPYGLLFRHNDAGDLPAEGRRHRFAVTNRAQHKTGESFRSRTSRSSCPASCELYDICYASVGPIRIHWERLLHWTNIGATKLDRHAVLKIADAASHLIGWTYTHWDWRKYEKTLLEATRRGFCINVSTSNPAEAVDAYNAGLPVSLVAPADQRKSMKLEGINAFVCPALLREGFTCDKCGNGYPLCARAERKYIILFPLHGSRAKKTWERITSLWEGWK